MPRFYGRTAPAAAPSPPDPAVLLSELHDEAAAFFTQYQELVTRYEAVGARQLPAVQPGRSDTVLYALQSENRRQVGELQQRIQEENEAAQMAEEETLELRRQLSDLQQRLQAESEAAQAAEQETLELKRERQREDERTLAPLRNKIDDAEKRVLAITSLHRELEHEAARLKASEASLAAAKDAIADECAALAAERDALHERVRATHAALQGEKDAHTACAARLREVSSRLDSHSAAATSEQRRADQHYEELRQARSELAGAYAASASQRQRARRDVAVLGAMRWVWTLIAPELRLADSVQAL